MRRPQTPRQILGVPDSAAFVGSPQWHEIQYRLAGIRSLRAPLAKLSRATIAAAEQAARDMAPVLEALKRFGGVA